MLKLLFSESIADGILGYFSEDIKKGVFRFSYYDFGEKCHIESLKIFPEYRNCGHGKKMIEELINHFKLDKDLQALTLNAYNDNYIAIHIYEKFGFKRIDNYGIYSLYELKL